MPPVPSSATISYAPSFVPALNDIGPTPFDLIPNPCFSRRNPFQLVEEVEDEHHFIQLLGRLVFRAGDRESLAVGMQVEIATGCPRPTCDARVVEWDRFACLERAPLDAVRHHHDAQVWG